jgi:hypothetical protein
MNRVMNYFGMAATTVTALAISTVIYSSPALQMGNGWWDHILGVLIFISVAVVIYHAYVTPIESVSPEWLATTLGNLHDELRQLQKAVDRLER